MTSVVFAAEGQEALAQELSAHAAIELGRLEVRNFPDGESYVRVETPVTGKIVFLACSLDRANSKFVPLILLAATLKGLGASRIVLVAPYLAYMRQDKAFKPGEGVSALTFAGLLSSHFDGLITVDPHLHRIQDLRALFRFPAITVAAAPELAAWIRTRIEMPMLVGPDSESEQWVSDVARRANCPFVVLNKIRLGDRKVEVSIPDADQLRGRTPVLVDDIISTAQTMISATRHLRALGLPAPVCIGVHAIFADDSYKELAESGASRIVTCNTIPHPSNQIDVNPLVSRAIVALHDEMAR